MNNKIITKPNPNKEDLEAILKEMEASLTLALEDSKTLAAIAKKVDPSFGKFSDDDLASAINKCNVLASGSNYRNDVEYYFNKLIELGLGATMGGKLPSEDFYA